MTGPLGPEHLDSFAVGRRVIAAGKPGVVESIAYSAATRSFLFVVAHDARMRLTYRIEELAPDRRSSCPTSTR